MKNILRLILFSSIVIIITATSVHLTNVDAASVKKVTLTVSAAASLKDAMEEIKQLYKKEKVNVTVTYNFGASGSLQQQIEQGAPVDVFLSAAIKQMDTLQSKGLIHTDTRVNLLENEIVLIVPKNTTTVKGFESLTESKVKRIALGQPKSVPVGQYSEELLTYLNILEKIKSKVVYGKDVREVLTWVETGNADAGIVYKTDARISKKVKIMATAPGNSHSPVIYPAAVIKDSKNAAAAKEYLNFLTGRKSQLVFEKYGFKFLRN